MDKELFSAVILAQSNFIAAVSRSERFKIRPADVVLLADSATISGLLDGKKSSLATIGGSLIILHPYGCGYMWVRHHADIVVTQL